MSLQAPATEITTSRRPLAATSPHLMPFHIAYSGPAPVSTYFRVKSAPAPSFLGDIAKSPPKEATRLTTPGTEIPTPSTSDTASTSQSTLVASSSTIPSALSSMTDMSSATLAAIEEVDMGSSEERGLANAGGAEEHFIAAFRGRTVRGLKISLPEGYAGLVLRNLDDAKINAPASSAKENSSARATNASGRRARRAPLEELGESEEVRRALEDVVPVRTLQPTATFSSLTLWNPDIPVDEGRDEYIRAINEWTRLASVIHQYDD